MTQTLPQDERLPEDRPAQKLVGQSIPRREDLPLLTGTARFIDDLRLPGMAYCKVLRSTTPHARLHKVDLSKALTMPGVLAGLCGEDLVGRIKPWGDMGGTMSIGDTLPFAADKILFEGQEIAAVVAETKYQALDALEVIELDYEELPPLVDGEEAIKPNAPLIQETVTYDKGDGNIFNRYRVRIGDIDQAEQDAEVVVRQRFVTNRQHGSALDPHGCIADYDSFTGILTLYSSTQSIALIKDLLADVLQIPRNRVRVIIPAVGAGFGAKTQLFPYEVIAALFSMRLGRPVHLVLGRGEIFRATTARTQHVRYAELCVTKDGKINGYRDYIVQNCGAMSVWGDQVIHIGTNVGMLPYPVPNIHVDADIVHTTTTPGGALRGFGIPQIIWAKEQLVDMAAEQLGMDPLELRARNIIEPDTFPYRTPMGQIIDSTSVSQCLQKAADAIGWQEKRAARKPYEGLGIAATMKYTSCRHPSFDTDLSAVRLRLETDGTITVFSSDVSHGQSHWTFLAQVIGDALGVTFDKIKLAPPDSATSPFGLGTFASRAAAVLGTAGRLAAERLREKVVTLAAHVLEVSPDDLETADNRVFVKGLPDKGMPLEGVAGISAYASHMQPPGYEPNLEALATYDTPTEREAPDGSGNFSVTYSGAVHAAHVRIDPDTGQLTILDYAMAHDTGTVINPLIVEGQHQGGFLMGVGMALGEEYSYDESGRLTTGSFKDYQVPYATELPELTKLYEIPAPSTTIPGGQKGAGESGTGPVPAVLGNAVYDATGIRFTALPITSQGILLALKEKERRGVDSLRFPDDMPWFTGPRAPEEWPEPRPWPESNASDEGDE